MRRRLLFAFLLVSLTSFGVAAGCASESPFNADCRGHSARCTSSDQCCPGTVCKGAGITQDPLKCVGA